MKPTKPEIQELTTKIKKQLKTMIITGSISYSSIFASAVILQNKIEKLELLYKLKKQAKPINAEEIQKITLQLSKLNKGGNIVVVTLILPIILFVLSFLYKYWFSKISRDCGKKAEETIDRNNIEYDHKVYQDLRFMCVHKAKMIALEKQMDMINQLYKSSNKVNNPEKYKKELNKKMQKCKQKWVHNYNIYKSFEKDLKFLKIRY
jgi:hypothetical protein